jgi:acyl-CoA synthetase (AMP-forming)/AMP-acid ligase II
MIFKSPYPDVEIPDTPLTPFLIQRMVSYGDKVALIDGPSGRSYTYQQLAGAIRLVASSLSKRGFGKGDVLAIYSPNLPEYAIAFHAVSLLGGIVTTVNPLYTADELAQQLNDANARYLLTISMFLENAKKAAEKSNI